MARNAFVFLLLGGIVAAGGCAVTDTGAFPRLQDEVVSLKRDVAALKAGNAPAPAERPDEIQSVRKNYADVRSDVDQLKSDLLATTTRVDETRVEMQRVVSRQNEQEQALREIRGNADRMKEIERRISALEERIAKAGATPPVAPVPVPANPQAWRSPEEMYEYAVGQIKGGNPKKGRETISEFAAKYPGHKLLPNALYWKGEAFYAEKDYENAILSFQDVVDRYPGGDKAPDAMYKQGLSFLALKDKKNAAILFELVPKKYPKSKAAELAKKKLKELR